MFRPRFISVIPLLVILAAGLILAGPAQAQPAEDFLEITTGGAYAEFGTPALPPLPADFFGPGSDPFEGHITFNSGRHLGGNPFDMDIFWENLPIQPLEPVGTSTWVPVEITELRLVSSEPVTVTYLGGHYPEQWNVEMGLSVVPPPPGTQHSTKTHVNGGTFSSTFHLQPSFRFTRVSDYFEVEFDSGLAGLPFLVLETWYGDEGHWVHDPDPTLDLIAPSAGLFVSCVEEDIPGDPTSQCPAEITLIEASDAMTIHLGPARFLPPPDPYCLVPGHEPGGSHIVFGPEGNPPIPADFFGPGSDPFEGTVALTGDPIGPTPWGEFEDADTIIRRGSHPFYSCEPAVPGDIRFFDIELLAMRMISIDPITVTYNGGQHTELWNLRMKPSPQGDFSALMVVFKTHDNGGIFHLETSWSPYYIFNRISDGYQVVLDGGLMGGYYLEYQAMGGHWVHAVIPDLQLLAPSDGHFVPGVEEMIPGDLGSQEIRILESQEMWGAGALAIRPTLRDMSGVEIPGNAVAVLQVVPNPFNPVTTFKFELAQAGPVSLMIYDLQGKLVRNLVQADLPAGPVEVSWHAQDDSGRRVASGVYLSVLRTGEGVQTAKMAVIK